MPNPDQIFLDAFTRTMQHEGGLSMDPADPGGMTYRGISREYHPDWGGWELVDIMVRGEHSAWLGFDEVLAQHVVEFYRKEFWNRLQCDFIASLSPAIAKELFDTAVNCGRLRAVEILQGALNLLNRNGKAYPDIAEDGRMGRDTRGALARYVADRMDETVLVRVMNHLQAMHYIGLMRANPAMERFVGWFGRT